MPANGAQENAIAGYYIFRRESGERCDRPHSHCTELNPFVPIRETGCIDYQVTPGQTYFYQVKAVSERGVLSRFSEEVKVKLP